MKARFIKSAKLRNLLANIEDNIDWYRGGKFEFLLNDSSYYFETDDLDIDELQLTLVDCGENEFKEVENCILVYKALGEKISHYLARDERLWTYMSHTYLLEYARKRWPIPADKQAAIKHIKAHFFCVGARGIERDNAASRLWWMAALCQRAGGMPLKEALTCFLYQSDVRANIVERPTTSQNILVFSAVLEKLNESYKSDKALFNRDKFRSVMKGINLQGGVKLLAALPKKSIMAILEDCIAGA